MADSIRNVAIIAHVDHGKTTLVDAMLRATGEVGDRDDAPPCILDSNPLERERGITILSKNCAVRYRDPDGAEHRINLVDTPGHADFGGEVERVLRMADGALLLVDAFEGPMPQTRFVLSKALELGLRIIVVVNKCDRPDARPDDVVTEVFDLLVALGADDETLDFPVIFASGRDGWTAHAHDQDDRHLNGAQPLFETIMARVSAPACDRDAPLQFLVTTLDYSEYVGRIAIGRVHAGAIESGQRIAICRENGEIDRGRALKVHRFEGLGRVPTALVEAGDLCAIEGIDDIEIGDTIAAPDRAVALPRVHVDEPTVHMLFRINDSPLAGTEGRYVTSRQISDRLERELRSNVALRVEPGEGADEFHVSGRGLLHLGVLIETMRREGYELSVGSPEVVIREIDGVKCEPMERLTVDVCPDTMGAALELLGQRSSEIENIEPRGDRMHVVCELPARALIGLRSRMLTATGGEAVMQHAFSRWASIRPFERKRQNGVMVNIENGSATGYALLALSERGVMFVRPQDKAYTGQIVGENSRPSDMGVNVVRAKAFSNVRESSKEATVTLKAPRLMSLEAALEYIAPDELVEVTPKSIRLRKRLLDENARKRAERREKSIVAG